MRLRDVDGFVALLDVPCGERTVRMGAHEQFPLMVPRYGPEMLRGLDPHVRLFAPQVPQHHLPAFETY